MHGYFASIYLEHISYFGTFILMALSGHLVPVPEEVILLLVGYASGIGLSNVYFTAIFSMLGVIAGDSLIFYLSRYGNCYVEKLKNRIAPQKIAKYERMMNAHTGKTIFLSWLMVGLRFLSPLLAGMLKVKWRTFLACDIPAIIIYVSFFLFLGYHFNTDIARMITEVKLARHIIFILLVTVAGLLLSYWAGKKFLRKINGV